MGIRKDFLIHKSRTIDSFKFVKVDISAINLSVEQLKNTLSAVEAALANLGTDIISTNGALDKCLSDISLQQINSLNINSKIDSVNKSVDAAAKAINSFSGRINGIAVQNQLFSKKINSQDDSIKKISSKNSSDIKKLTSALKNSQKEIVMLRSIFNRSLVAAKKANLSLESTLKKQRDRIVELNQKIDGKKAISKKITKPAKLAAKKLSPKKIPKINVRKRKLQGKTIITVKTPNKTLVEAITPSKGGNVKVVRGRNPLI